MQVIVREMPLKGCYEILPAVLGDERGSFIKTFHAPAFSRHGLCTDWREEYFSVSQQGVLRGLHFQTPPHDHAKLVYCVGGAVLDAVVDLRSGSPDYGKHTTIELNADKANMLYIPAGMAHGFYVLRGPATMMYKVSTVYSSEHDRGILWNSVGIPWPDNHPLISTRDAAFEAFCDFESPFS